MMAADDVISVGRTLSAWTTADIVNNQLKITYSVYNQQAEAVSGVLLTTALQADVELVNASILPDRSGQQLAWSLGTLAPFGRASVEVTVEFAGAIPLQLDAGAEAFGTLNARAVRDGAPAAMLRAGPIDASLLASTPDANTTDPFVQAKAAQLDYDPNQIFAYLTEDVGYESYIGSLRGARGTMWSSAGNALDEASLGVALMRASGIPAQYAHGTLSDALSRELILSMFPESFQTLGYLPPGTDIADPANDPKLLAETRDHYWFQFDTGGGFVNADTTFADATIGQAFTTTTGSFAEVADAQRHKVRVQLDAETWSQAGAAFGLNNGLSTKTVLDQTFNTVDLVGRPISIGQFVSESVIPSPVFVSRTITYSPYIVVGSVGLDEQQLAEPIRGADFQEMLTNFPLGSSVVTGMFLKTTVSGPDGLPEVYDRALVDRIGFAARSGLVSTGVSIDPNGPPSVSSLDTWTINVQSSQPSPQALGAQRALAEQLQQILTEFAARYGQALSEAELAALDEDAVAMLQDALIAMGQLRLGQFEEMADLGAARLADQLKLKAYLNSPRITIFASQVTWLGEGKAELNLGIDLQKSDLRAIVGPGNSTAANVAFQTLRGFAESALEAAALGDGPELEASSPVSFGAAVSTQTIFEAAAAQGISLVALAPQEVASLDALALPANAKALITDALMDGKIVIVPTSPVTIDGELRVGWYEVDENTGEAVGVLDDGTHGTGLIGKTALYRLVAFQQNATAFARGFITGLTATSIAKVATFMLGMAISASINYQSLPYAFIALQLKNAYKLAEKLIKAELQSLLNKFTPGNNFSNGLRLGVLVGLAVSTDPERPEALVDSDHSVPTPPKNHAEAEVAVSASHSAGAVQGNLQLPSLAVSGDLTSSWTSSSSTFQMLALNAGMATVTNESGQSMGAGAVALSGTNLTPATIAGSGINHQVSGEGSLAFYGPADSDLGVSGQWQSYTATITGNVFSITITTDGLTLNGITLPAGTYTITTSAATLSGSGNTSSPNFAGSAAVTATGGKVELGPGTGDLSVGGTPLDAGDGVTLEGYTGTVQVTAGGNDTDSVLLDGSAANILQVAPNPQTLSADQNTPVTFQANIQTNFADTYLLTIQAPKGWTVAIDEQGQVTVTPKPGLQSGTYPIQVIARSQTNPNLVAQSTVDVTVAPTLPGITLAVERDLLFTVPFNGAQVPTAFRAAIQNLGPDADTFNLTFPNLPTSFTVLNTGTAVTVPAGRTGVLGLYLAPSGGSLPLPGTVVSFNVTATSVSDPSVTQTVLVEFTVPEIHGVRLVTMPTAVNISPNGLQDVTLRIENVGNVPETIDVTAMGLPPGVSADFFGAGLAVDPGLYYDVLIQVFADDTVALNTNLSLTVVATFGPTGSPVTQSVQIPVRVQVPGADSIASAAVAANQIGNTDLGSQLGNLATALTNLFLAPTNSVFKSQALASLDAVIRQAAADPFLAGMVEQLGFNRDNLAAAVTADDVANAIGNLAFTLRDLDVVLTQVAAHGFMLQLSPNSATALPGAPALYTVILQNTGTQPTTYNLTVEGLPPGITGSFNHPSVTLQPGEILAGGPNAIILSLTQATGSLVPAEFIVRVTAQLTVFTFATVSLTAPGTLTVRESFVNITSVTPTPAFAPAGTTVAVSAKVLNAVAQEQAAIVSYVVTDTGGTVVFVSADFPVTLSVQTTLDSVNLGTLNTGAFADGAYTITVTVEDADGNPFPGATGQGTLVIGSPVTASVTTSPPAVPQGNVTVTTTLSVTAQTVFTPPFTLVGQVATTPVSSTIVVHGTTAYVAGSNGVDIVDVSDPTAPVLLSTFAQSLIVQGGYTVVRELPGDRIVIASTTTFNANGTTVLVYSLADPLNPALLSNTLLQQAFMSDFLVSGSVGLLTTNGSFLFGNNSAGHAFDQFGDVTAIDFDAPGGPAITSRLEGTRSPPFTGDHSMTGGAIVDASTAYVTTSTLTGDNFTTGTGRLLVVDYSDPSDLVLTRELLIPGTVILYHVGIDGNLALVVGSNRGNQNPWNNNDADPSNDGGNIGNLTLTTLDITDPTNPVVISTVVTTAVFPRGNQPSSKLSVVPIGGGKFAVSLGIVDGDPVIFLVDASDPANIAASALQVNTVVSEMTVRDGKLYTTSADGLLIYDIGEVDTTPVTISVRVPKTGITIVPDSFNIPPTRTIVGPDFDTLEWDRPLAFGLSSGTITWRSTVSNIQPGEVRSATLGTDVVLEGADPFSLPATIVTGAQVIGLSPAARTVAPGETATYTVTFYNPSEFPRGYFPSIDGVPADWVDIPGFVPMPAGGSTIVTLRITPPAFAELTDYGFVVTVLIDGTGGGRGSVQGSLTVSGAQPTVDAQAHGVVAEITPAQRTAGQGTAANYVVRVTNTGSAVDTFDLSLVGLPAGFTVTFAQPSIVVPSGASNFREVSLTVQVAPGVAAGNYPFTVVAASSTQSGISDEVAGTIDVLAVGVDVEFIPGSGAPGSTYQLKVTNTGQTTETFDLSLAASAALAATLGMTSVTLAPGAFQMVPVNVGAINFAFPGALSLVGIAKARTNNAVQDADTASVNIEGRLGMTAAFDDSSVQLNQPDRASFVLLVNNIGNLEDQYVAEIIGATGPVAASLVGLDGQAAQSIPIFILPGLSTGAVLLNVDLTALAAATVTVRVRSLTDNTIIAQATANIVVPIPDDIGDVIVLGSVGGDDVRTRVKVIDPTNGAVIVTFTPYGNSFHGGVRVATADLDKDGILEIITAPGPGRSPLVKVFDLQGNERTEYRINAYGNSFTGGVYVAVGDVDGDGYFEIITTPSGERSAEVRVWRNRLNKGDRYEHDVFASTAYRSFLAFGGSFLGGATVAADDLTGDNRAEIVVGNGPGMAPRVRVFDLTKFKQATTPKLGDFIREIRPFESADRGGVFVAAGNIRGSVVQIIVGNGINGRGEVEIYRANGTLQHEFTPYPSGDLNAPVHVARQNYDGGRLLEILTSQGSPGSSLNWRVWEYDADLVDEALEDDLDFRHGFFVA